MKLDFEETMFLSIVIATIIMSLQGVRSQPPSPLVWHRLDDAVYLVDSVTKVPYDQAQALCQDYGANLARIDSEEIQAFLTTFITPPLRDTRCFWIGCDDREVEGQYMWLDGTQVMYDGWAPNQPDNRGDQNCACLWSRRDGNNHGRWDDDRCTIKRNLICQKGLYSFQLGIPRTNPGFASVSCAVDVEADGETLSADDVKLSIGQTLSSSRRIPYSSTNLDGEFRNNSFLLYNINENDEIFCYVGELPGEARSFSLATFSPVFNFYALPVLTSGPTVENISSSTITVSWNSWIPCLDSGDGPVVGYLIYYQIMGAEWVEVGGVEPRVGADLQRRMEFVLTGLEPGIEYNISVSAVRKGVGGEGPRGPHVTVMTTLLDNEQMKKSDHVWIALFWTSLVVNVILVVAMLVVCKRQKKVDLSSLRVTPAAGAPKSHDDHYELPQPTGINHTYQDLTGTARRNEETVYADIPEKLDYVNISPEVQK